MAVSIEAGEEIARNLLASMRQANHALRCAIEAGYHHMAARQRVAEARAKTVSWQEIAHVAGVSIETHFPNEYQTLINEVIEVAEAASKFEAEALASLR